MSKQVEKSVSIVLRGSFFTLIGTVIGAVSGFASKIIITRSAGPEVFGIFSLCIGIVTLAYMLSTFGLSVGIARFVAYFNGRSEENKAHQASLISLKVGFILSVLIFIAAFFLSDYISIKFFPKIPNLSFLLKMIFVTIPFYALLDIAVGVARGNEDPIPKVFFLDFIKNGVFLLLLLFAVLFGLSVRTIICAYIISVILPSVAAYLYISKAYKVNFTARESSGVSLKDLLVFSLPLMLMPIMWLVLGTMDTVMLGYYRTANEVGIYNASASLAKIFNTITLPITFMFLPVLTQYYANKLFTEMSFLYMIFTKWIFTISLPFFAVLVFFPDLIITKLFGAGYLEGVLCLRIIVIGYLPSLLLGMNNVALTASGQSTVQMLLSIFTIALNIILNIVLIPKYGLNGAAAATALSFTMFNAISSLILYKHSKVHPFTTNFLKTILSAAISLWLFFLLTKNFNPSLYHIPFFLPLFALSHLFFIILFNGINKHDLMALEIIERKIGIQFTGLRRLVNRISTIRGE